MIENTKNQIEEINQIDEELQNDDEVVAIQSYYQAKATQRKVALIASLLGNMTFLVAAYAILCYDTSGRLFGQLLGLNS